MKNLQLDIRSKRTFQIQYKGQPDFTLNQSLYNWEPFETKMFRFNRRNVPSNAIGYFIPNAGKEVFIEKVTSSIYFLGPRPRPLPNNLLTVENDSLVLVDYQTFGVVSNQPNNQLFIIDPKEKDSVQFVRGVPLSLDVTNGFEFICRKDIPSMDIECTSNFIRINEEPIAYIQNRSGKTLNMSQEERTFFSPQILLTFHWYNL